MSTAKEARTPPGSLWRPTASSPAEALALDLPFGFALSPQTLGTAGFTPLQVSDILATVDFFQGLLPALIVNITAFRIGLEGGCRPAPIA